MAIFIFLAFYSFKNNSSRNISIEQKETVKYIKIGDKTIKVDVVSTPELLEKGLSGRKDMKEDEGMLFVFKNSSKYSFWMKNMNFAIDMIWINESLNVVYIKKDAKPESFPEVFSTNTDAKYVLEVMSGFSKKNNLKEGDSVKFLP